MQFQVNRQRLLNAVQKAEKVVPNHAALPIMTCILIEANEDCGELSLHATDFDASIWYTIGASETINDASKETNNEAEGVSHSRLLVNTSGRAVVNAKLLLGVLTLLKGDTVNIGYINDRATQIAITDEKSKFSLNCLPPNDYPPIQRPAPTSAVPLTKLCTLAKKTIPAAATSDDKPVLQCVSIQLQQSIATATDGLKMMMVRMDKQDSANCDNLLIPAEKLKLLASISSDADVFDIGVTDRHILFTKQDMAFAMRRIEGEFIQPLKIIKAVVPKYEATVNAIQMREALSLVQAGITEALPINIVLLHGSIRFMTESANHCITHEIDAEVAEPTPPDGFYYKSDGLDKLLSVLHGRIKIEMDAQGMMLIKTQNEVCFQIPQRKPVITKQKKAGKTPAKTPKTSTKGKVA